MPMRTDSDSSFEDLGFARVDTDRKRRCGFPEVVFCPGKTPEQVTAIMATIAERDGLVLATRADPAHAAHATAHLPGVQHHATARALTLVRTPLPVRPHPVALVAAGTSDLPVAEEAAVTLGIFGNRVERFFDVGVAGLHRLLAVREAIVACRVVIVVAGMEGALPSVVAGLIDRPIIAVPTSIGYGTAFGGLTALLGMLNSCGSGVTVVNIDNGFGAAYAAAQINRLSSERTASSAEP